MKINLKERKGITLVALIITVVILLILAGVALNIALGDNGIFKKSKQAAELYKIKQAEEENQLDNLYNNLKLGVTSSRDEIDSSTLQNILDRLTALESSNANQSVPIGTIIAYYGETAPEGYLECNGQVYDLTQDSNKKYINLAKFLGASDDATSFTAPDLRGEFLRGTGTNSHSGQGKGENVRTHQDSSRIINPESGNSGNSFTYIPKPDNSFIGNSATLKPDTYTYSEGLGYWKTGTEITSDPSTRITSYTIRPTNTSVLYCIKY